MSFVIAVYVPEGIVMAGDSRQMGSIDITGPDGKKLPPVHTPLSDFTYKLFLLKGRCGVSTHGEAVLGGVQMESHMRRIEEESLTDDDTITTILDKTLAHFKAKFPSAKTGFHFAGFQKEGRASVPHVYIADMARNDRRRVNFDEPTNRVLYGCTWSGESDTISLLLRAHSIHGIDNQPQRVTVAPIIYDAMNLQDAIDFAVYAVRTTADTMRFQARPKTVGGPIDVLLITPDGAQWIQRKQLHA